MIINQNYIWKEIKMIQIKLVTRIKISIDILKKEEEDINRYFIFKKLLGNEYFVTIGHN